MRSTIATEEGRRAASVAADVTLVRGIEAMSALRAAWVALEGVLGEPDFFQSFAWSMQVAEVRLRAGTRRYEPLCAVLQSNGDVRAIWPLALERRAGQTELRSLDDPFGQLAGLLACDAASGEALVAGTLALVGRQGLAGAARFERVIEGSALGRALQVAGATARGGVEAPYVTFGGHPSFSDLKLSRNRKSMKNLRNAFNRLERAGTIASTFEREPARTLAIGRTALANRERWLEATARTAPAFRVAGFADILLGESRWGLEEKRAGFELRLGDDALAQQLGFIHAGRYYAYISGMDWSREALAPGRVHLAMVLEAVHGAGLQAAELLTPASDYKMMWTDTTHRLADMVVPLSAAGRVKQTLWDDGLRPALKSAYYAMPARLRRAIAGLAHKS